MPSTSLFAPLLVSFCFLLTAEAHMSMWHPSMYGVGPDWAPLAGSPGDPIGPDILTRHDWWFRGPEYRSLKPQNDSVMVLPAGGHVEIEIACNVAFTSYGVSPSNLSDPLAACPGNSGAFHSGTPGEPINEELLSGCALAIADKDDIEDVGWDDLVVFSVNKRCVRDRITSFQVPEQLPKCTGEKCICAWLWLANNGTGNFYMTGFDCSVEPGPSPLPILPPVDPEFCPSTNETCAPTKGAKRPLYAYNSPSNIEWQGNDNRPGYHESWSFFDGAQNDIFERDHRNESTDDTWTSSTRARSRPCSSASSPLPESTARDAFTEETSGFSRPSRLSNPSRSAALAHKADSTSTSTRGPTASASAHSKLDVYRTTRTTNSGSPTSTVWPRPIDERHPTSTSLAHALKLALPTYEAAIERRFDVESRPRDEVRLNSVFGSRRINHDDDDDDDDDKEQQLERRNPNLIYDELVGASRTSRRRRRRRTGSSRGGVIEQQQQEEQQPKN